ncbi:MAG: EVE domain-containing protein [Planctomycetes bacterium]|nr:EVE domain-containing protein [Planctomycetota bacterium]
MAHFLFKTEPSEYSYDDLVQERHTTWDGVSNALALKHLRTAQEGDDVVIYHTGEERQAVGLARVIRAPYEDPKDPKLTVVDLLVAKRFTKPVTLKEMQATPAFADFELLRLPRLSILPVTEKHWTEMLRMAGLLPRR